MKKLTEAEKWHYNIHAIELVLIGAVISYLAFG